MTIIIIIYYIYINKWCTIQLLATYRSLPRQPTPHSFTNFFFLHDVICYVISLWPVWIIRPGSVSHQLSVPLQLPLLAEQYKMLKNPWLYVAATQQQLKYWCAINIVFLPKWKHNIIPRTINRRKRRKK